MIKVDLKGSEKEFESGVSVAEVAKSIGMGLYKSACAAKVNGEGCDLRTVLNEDCKVEILTFDDKEGKKEKHRIFQEFFHGQPSLKSEIQKRIVGRTHKISRAYEKSACFKKNRCHGRCPFVLFLRK